MKKPIPFSSTISERAVHVAPIVTRPGTQMATDPKVCPVELKGMDLVPLSQLMTEHDPQWESGA